MTQYMCDCFGEFNTILMSGFMKEGKILKLNRRMQQKIDVWSLESLERNIDSSTWAANGVYLWVRLMEDLRTLSQGLLIFNSKCWLSKLTLNERHCSDLSWCFLLYIWSSEWLPAAPPCCHGNSTGILSEHRHWTEQWPPAESQTQTSKMVSEVKSQIRQSWSLSSGL